MRTVSLYLIYLLLLSGCAKGKQPYVPPVESCNVSRPVAVIQVTPS